MDSIFLSEEKNMDSIFLSDETGGITKREKLNTFMTQDSAATEYDLSWHDKNRIVSAEDRKNFKNVLSSVITTGYRKPQTAIIGTDEENYKSDDAILQELKRESVQHFIGRSTNLEEQRLDRFADVIGAEEQEKSEAEKAAINDRLVKKSSHRWNKTKRSDYSYEDRCRFQLYACNSCRVDHHCYDL